MFAPYSEGMRYATQSLDARMTPEVVESWAKIAPKDRRDFNQMVRNMNWPDDYGQMSNDLPKYVTGSFRLWACAPSRDRGVGLSLDELAVFDLGRVLESLPRRIARDTKYSPGYREIRCTIGSQAAQRIFLIGIRLPTNSPNMPQA